MYNGNMAGIRIVTNLDREKASAVAKDVARDAGFAVKEGRNGVFSLRKGSLALGLLAAPVAPHCNFDLAIEDGRDGNVELVLERNSPWWGGVVAVNQVQKRAEELMDSIAAGIEQSRGKILKRTTF